MRVDDVHGTVSIHVLVTVREIHILHVHILETVREHSLYHCEHLVIVTEISYLSLYRPTSWLRTASERKPYLSLYLSL